MSPNDPSGLAISTSSWTRCIRLREVQLDRASDDILRAALRHFGRKPTTGSAVRWHASKASPKHEELASYMVRLTPDVAVSLRVWYVEN
jgi:hypothetical protein